LKSINDGIAANSQSITSLTTLLQEARSDIGDLKTTTGAHTLAISTLEQNVTNLQEALGKIDLNNYVTVEMFESTVGSLDELQAQTSTLHTQVKELQEALTWTELTI
jgi:chromosome segregation ATPase